MTHYGSIVKIRQALKMTLTVFPNCFTIIFAEKYNFQKLPKNLPQKFTLGKYLFFFITGKYYFHLEKHFG